MDWKDEIPKNLESVPGAFGGFLSRINVCLRAVRALAAMRGSGGITVKVSDGNIVIESSVPVGYGPEEFMICDSGTPVARKFLTNSPD